MRRCSSSSRLRQIFNLIESSDEEDGTSDGDIANCCRTRQNRPRGSEIHIPPLRAEVPYSHDESNASDYRRQYYAAIQEVIPSNKVSTERAVTNVTRKKVSRDNSKYVSLRGTASVRRLIQTRWISIPIQASIRDFTVGLILEPPTCKSDGPVVKRILPGSLAWLCGRIKLQDELLSISGVSTQGRQIDEVSSRFREAIVEALKNGEKLRISIRREIADQT